MGTSKNLPFCFSTKSKRAMCGASPHTPTSKNIVFRGSLMMIDDVSYSKIKETKTYPSILWIYSMFLYEISLYEKASNYSLLSINKYKELNQKTREFNDALAIYCLAEIELFKQTQNNQHLSNARLYRQSIHSMHYGILLEHLRLLDEELAKLANRKL